MILQILNALKQNSSTTVKKSILKEYKDNETLKRVFYMTYCRQVDFGIRKIPEYTEQEKVNSLSSALDLLKPLQERKITGNAAINYLSNLLGSVSPDDAIVLERIISRDLDCGTSRAIANSIWKGLIPEQPQQLATAYSDKALENIVYPAFGELKADGARGFAELRFYNSDDEDSHEIKILSRSGNQYLGLKQIEDELYARLAYLRSEYPNGLMVDGELEYEELVESGLDFLSGEAEVKEGANRTLSNGIANKSLSGTISIAEAKQMKFKVWDIVPLNEVYSDNFPDSEKATYFDRSQFLRAVFSDSKYIIPIEQTVVYSLEEAKALFRQYTERGYEGIILKNTKAFWENRRSKNLVKFKEVFTIDLKCIGKYPHSKDPTKLGGIHTISECGQIEVDVGSGFKEDGGELDRTLLMSQDIDGWIFECECNGLVTKKNKLNGPKSLFLGVVKRVRLDKTKANTLEEVFG